MFNGIPIGKATLSHNQQQLRLTIKWELEIPDVRQIDITIFLLEVFRCDPRLGSEPGLDEYHKISMVTNHLYAFEIQDRYCSVQEQSLITHVDIYSADEP